MRLQLGRHARSTDGGVRSLVDVVIDASGSRVTHLVLQPKDDPDAARLVPIEFTQASTNEDEVSLTCTTRQLDEMRAVRSHEYLQPGEEISDEPGWDVGAKDMQAMPVYLPGAYNEYAGDLGTDLAVTYDRVPEGEIELRHASAIYSADRHHLGRVDGLLVEADGRISHLLLERGHLWWRREISIPAEAVDEFATDVVTLGVTKGAVGGFPKQRSA
jgi:hypothetical protein